MALVIGRGAVFKLQIGGIDGRVFKRNLIVVGIVECLCQRVCGVELSILGKVLTNADPEGVVLGIDGGLKIGNIVGTLSVRVVYRADRAANDEASSKIMHAVYFYQQTRSDLLLDANVELLHHGAAQAVVDDVDAGSAGSGELESAKRTREHLRSTRAKCAIAIEIDGYASWIGDDVAGGHVQSQRAPIEALFERHDFERDAIVVDAVTAVNAEVRIDRIVEADARAPIVQIVVARALVERLQ